MGKRLTLAHVKPGVSLSLEFFMDTLTLAVFNALIAFLAFLFGLSSCWFVYVRPLRQDLINGFSTIITHFGYLRTNALIDVPINALILVATNLEGLNKDTAIGNCIVLATVYDNREMFLALRDTVPKEDLLRALRARDNLETWIQGSGSTSEEAAQSREAGEKFVFFALGTRTLIHLDAPIEEAERRDLEKYITNYRNAKRKKR